MTIGIATNLVEHGVYFTDQKLIFDDFSKNKK